MRCLPSLTVIVSLLILAGCSAPANIHPHNQIADQNLIEQSASLKNDLFSVADWPAQKWWKRLGDSQLDTLIAEAMEHSPDIQLASANLVRASSMVMAADSQFEPNAAITASVARARLSRSEDYSFEGNRFGEMRNLGVNFSYSFDLWGGERAAWEASVNNQKAAEIDHQATEVALSTGIVRTYIQLANAYALQDLADKNLQRSNSIVKITKYLLDNGLTSDDRLYTAQSTAAGAKQAVKQRQLAVQQLNNALATLVGMGPDRAATIVRPRATMTEALSLPENIPANLIAHRPDIMAAKWRVEASSKQIDAAKSRFYPNVNLNAMAGFKGMLGDAVFEDVSQSWNVAPAISLPIFRTGLKANLIEKTADYDSAIAQYNKTLITALSDVSDSILTLQSTEQQLVDAQQSMVLADKSYAITEQRYQAGMGSQLEVLMAELQLLQAESSFTLLKNQQQEAQVILIGALGGGYGLSASPN
jgi:NodT family efflux transporter outer membrane factor (OMF) lipoprotein